jgi:anti-sigma B factor antagonist
MSDSALAYAPSSVGYVVRVEGRGAIADAAALRAFVTETLASGEGDVILDLTECDHLDSTFLGSLVTLHRSCRPNDKQFLVYLPTEDRKRLFGCCRLDTLLRFTDRAPKPTAAFTPLSTPKLRVDEFGHIIMESHERLAELGGKNAEAFRRVADRIAVELSKSGK